MPGLAAIMTYFAAIFGRPAPRPAALAYRLHTRAMRGTVMLRYVLPEQPGRQLDRLIKVLRIAIDGLWVDSRHDVLVFRSGAVR
jgi:hypothetical protein